MTHPTVWLARHGETEWSANGRHTGRTDLPLTPAGEIAARSLSTVLGTQRFSAVLCSPLLRARQTCELTGVGAPTVVDDLREWDYGDYEGVTTEEIHATRPGWSVFADGCPGGEDAADVGRRMDRVVERLRRLDGPVAVFGHGHSLRVLAARWVGLGPQNGAHLLLSTATISVLGWERETPVISRWNA